MAEKWKINGPVFQHQPEETTGLNAVIDEAIAIGDDLCGKYFKGETLAYTEGQSLDFTGCVFERCIFNETDLKRVSFADCVFDKCEWSNVPLAGATFQRVRFQNCRMTGMEFLRVVLMNTVFDGCMMDYLSLSETKLDRVSFEQCRIRESLWNEIRMPKVRFENSDLSKAQWVRTLLNGVDMSTCQIEGWNISLFDLRGIKLTAAQVISLSGLLGVEIIS